MIDLHIHTNNSDGQFDVITILKRNGNFNNNCIIRYDVLKSKQKL